MLDTLLKDTVLEIGGHQVKVGESRCSLKESDHPWYIVHIDNEFGYLTQYRRGVIRRTLFRSGKYSPELYKDAPTLVVVEYRDGQVFEWTVDELNNAYNGQFGLSVSLDGRFVFVQSWEKGLLCHDARTGERVWRSKRRFGITNIYVNPATVLCHQRERALQLLDLENGEVVKEKKPARDWGFSYLREGYILCHTSARSWEIIRTEDLETVETFSDKLFGSSEWCINSIRLIADDKLVWQGFQNCYDDSVTPPKMLPNRVMTGEVEVHCFSQI